MNVQLLVIALFQIVAGLVLGTAILFFGFKIMRFWLKKSFKIEKLNEATTVLLSATLFAIGLFLKTIIEPLINTFQRLQKITKDILYIIPQGGLYTLVYFSLAAVFSFIVVFISSLLFTLFTTQIDEMEEIRKNNWGIALLLGVVIIVISLIVSDGFRLLIESLIPFPKLPKRVS
ncbi:MAG: DUF350 domain-containing protein [Spirochaetales bacterium]|nr:DUF350 domain-containing protein [Spirochaetales bacterium]